MSRWIMDIKDKPLLRLTTQDFGASTLSATAPITGGSVDLTKGVRVQLELSLGSIKTGNFLTQSAVRALIKKYNGDRLVFEAAGAADEHPWSVTGVASAGRLDIPMTVLATPAAEMTALQIGGTVTMNDVRIPIPGLSGTSTVTFDLDGRVHLTPA